MRDYSAFPLTEGVRTFLPAPEGYQVDFDHPKRNYDVVLYSIVGVGNFLCLFFMYQRLYTKIRLSSGLQIEDGFMIASWILSLLTQGSVIGGVALGGGGTHAWEQPIERFVQFKLSIYIGGSVFMPCTSCAKIALLLFYLRLSPQKWFRYSVWATIALIALYCPAIFLALLFACSPIDSQWNVDVKGVCIDTTALFIATCVVNSFTDILLFLLPIPTVWGLKMPTTQKIGLVALFSVGLVTIITSVIRAAILPKMSGPDQSWVTAEASIWSMSECNLTIICGTVPTLKRFLKHVFPRFMGSSWSSERKSSKTPALKPSPFRTIGGSYRNRYAQFGGSDGDVEMDVWEGDRGGAKGAGVSTVIMGPEDPKSEDDNSDRAIVMTKTVVINSS